MCGDAHMEILILSCGTGGGHNAAGRAVAEELERRGHTVTCLDPFQLVGRHTAGLVGGAYIQLVQRSPRLFGMVYALGQAYRRLPIHSPVYWLNGKLANSLGAYLADHPADALVMPHIYPGQTVAWMKKTGAPLPPTFLVTTDYTCIPFAEETGCDYVVIPSPELEEEFSGRGIPRECLHPLGIPVSAGFRRPPERAEARRRLDLPQNGTCILLSGGSIGVGKLGKAVGTLTGWLARHPEAQLTVVCGSNRKLYQKLTEKYGQLPQLRILESTTHMADYLAACDVFVSKPGGLSSTEAAASRTPLIHIAPIPGCESRNADFFHSRGMSLFVKNPGRELPRALDHLLDPAAQQEMRSAQARYVDPLSAVKICDLIEAAPLRQ